MVNRDTELDDALLAMAVLKGIPGIDPRRLGGVGHSFGGALALLVAARDTAIKATVDFAGGAGSWSNPDLRNTLTADVKQLTRPVLFVFALMIIRPSQAGFWRPS